MTLCIQYKHFYCFILLTLAKQLAEKAETSSEADDRLAAVEARLAELASAARDARLRHAQLDLFLDQLRAARAADTPVTEDVVTEVPNRADALELAVAELLDGPDRGFLGSRQLPRDPLEIQDRALARGQLHRGQSDRRLSAMHGPCRAGRRLLRHGRFPVRARRPRSRRPGSAPVCSPAWCTS